MVLLMSDTRSREGKEHVYDIIDSLRKERLRKLAPCTREWYVEHGDEAVEDWTKDPDLLKNAIEDRKGHYFYPCKCGSYYRRAESKHERFNRICGSLRNLFPDESNNTVYGYALNYTCGVGMHTLVCNKCGLIHKPVKRRLTEEETKEQRDRRNKMRVITMEMMPSD